MASFFEKLKKGMGAEGAEMEEIENEDDDEIEAESKDETPEEPKEEAKEIPVKEESEKKKIKTRSKKSTGENKQKKEMNNKKEKDAWSSLSKDGEGQLAVDVYQTEDYLVIQSAIAGVKPETLDVVIEGDMVSIKGSREKPQEDGERNYFYQECFWGPFSREIILSVEVDPSRTEASLKDGILTVRVPKIERDRKRKIEVKS